MYLVPTRSPGRDRYFNLHKIVYGDMCRAGEGSGGLDVLKLLMIGGVEIAVLGPDARRIAHHLDGLVVDEELPPGGTGESTPQPTDPGFSVGHSLTLDLVRDDAGLPNKSEQRG